MSPLLACEAFVSVEEVLDSACACDLDEDTHGEMIEEFADDASDILYVLSGGRISGRCTRTVWPFRPFSACQPWGFGGARWPSGYVGYRESWLDYDGIDSIPLMGPDTEIIEVTIDGLVLDPSEYGLLDGNKLFRKAGSWPSSNDITKDDSEDGTFTITYSFGSRTNLTTKRAAIELICMMTKSESQGLTRLRGVVSANVQGVSVTLDDDEVRSMGLPEVARFMDIYGGVHRGGAWSPELNHGWRLLSVSGPSGS